MQCSFSVCMKEREDNRRAAEEYANEWRARSRMDTFECFYNTADHEDVIAEKVYSQSDVIHSMLWPSVVIVICCAVFLRLEHRRRHLTFCGRRPPPHESSAPVASRCATPEARDFRVVVVRSSSTAGRFPVPDGGSPIGRHVGRAAAVDVKPWKSYSSLEQALCSPSSSCRSPDPRDLARSANRRRVVEVRAMTPPQRPRRADDELTVVRDERKLSLTIPGENHPAAAKIHQFPRGSCDL